MKTTNKKINFVIDYALCYLHAAWDEIIEEDMQMSHSEFINILEKFQSNKIKIKQHPTE